MSANPFARFDGSRPCESANRGPPTAHFSLCFAFVLVAGTTSQRSTSRGRAAGCTALPRGRPGRCGVASPERARCLIPCHAEEDPIALCFIPAVLEDVLVVSGVRRFRSPVPAQDSLCQRCVGSTGSPGLRVRLCTRPRPPAPLPRSGQPSDLCLPSPRFPTPVLSCAPSPPPSPNGCCL